MLRRAMMAGASGPPPADPYWANVVSLLHFDGADGSTAFTDQKGKTWARTGTVAIDTDQSKFGGASGLFSSGYLDCVGGTDFAFGTGDFTIEFWLRATQFGATPGGTLFDNRVTGGPAIALFQPNGTSRIDAYLNGAVRISTPSGLSNNTWIHLALCRGSGTTRFFVGGVSAGTYADASNYGDGVLTNFRLGANLAGGSTLAGWLDDWRVTKGIARYTSDFAPPAAPFPNS